MNPIYPKLNIMSNLADEIFATFTKVSSTLKTLKEKVSKSESQSFESRLEKLEDFHKTFTSITNSEIYSTGNQQFGEYTMSLILSNLKKLERNSSLEKFKSNKYKFDLILSKLSLLMRSLPHSFKLPESDFECLPDDHPRKKHLSSITNTISLDQETISKQLKPFIKKYNSIKAAFYKICKYKSSSFRNLMLTTLMTYYTLFYKKCKKAIAKCDLKSNVEPMYQLWNVTESSIMKTFLPINFPSIHYNKLIYIPRLSPHILDSSQKPQEKEEHYIDLISQEPLLAGSRYTFLPDGQNLRIGIRILSSFTLHKIQHEEMRESGSCCGPSHSEHIKAETLIIHIHGGGFIGQTSFTHQNYTRQWAKSLNVPVLCIDYRLAPNHPFPDALDDVWQSYTWIVKYAHKFLGIVPHRIILAGDSAGGNFAIGVIIKAKSCGFRIPDGLLLVYPAVNMDIEYVSKGGFGCLDDPILGYRGLLNILQNYVGKEEFRNQFVSPIFCEDSVLAAFPKTKMILTMNDPLYSDALRLADRLLTNQVDLEIIQFEGFVHGAMNLGHSNGVPIFERVVKESLNLFRGLIS